ncbi:hypothetical protein Q5692_35685 [Microcoleus sp. C2C3]|uniref:hypothetical protein n=1 Tax=unclassified Microcoleus TaxID=2642155 RepID=UPI002FCF60B2
MNDLTWAELLATLAPNSIFVDATKGICVSVSLVSGETTNLNALTQLGVVEFAYKLLDAANRAQTSKNATLPTGSKLNAFGAPTWSTPTSTGTVTARHSVSAQFTVSTAVATAPLI